MGRAFVFGDNIDTDQILPGEYLTITNKEELALHCMEGIDPDFPDQFEPGDVVVAGENFGGGSSREHAPLAIRENGAAAVVAASFARIFYRNAINIGLPVIELEDTSNRISDGDELTVDPGEGTLTNRTKDTTYEVTSHPPFIQEIIDAGGLIEYGKGVIEQEEETNN